MAKENGNGNGNGRLKWVSLIITVVILFSGLVTTWALYGENIKDNTEDIAVMNVEGCKPIQPLKQRVSLVEYRLDEFSKEQKTIKANTEEILKRLPK